jgi:ubiquinone/menaquinone biosynthesis C-methylase UbiE
MKLFGKLGGPHDLAVSMVGPKLGDELLQVGSGDGGLAASLAAKVGLTGRACVVDATQAGLARAERGAVKRGVLVELTEGPPGQLPHPDAVFDIVVLNDLLAGLDQDARRAALRETRRVLRPGKRLMVVEPLPKGRLAGLFDAPTSKTDYGGAEAALKDAGFVAVRTLAERDGLRFVEGVAPRSAAAV